MEEEEEATQRRRERRRPHAPSDPPMVPAEGHVELTAERPRRQKSGRQNRRIVASTVAGMQALLDDVDSPEARKAVERVVAEGGHPGRALAASGGAGAIDLAPGVRNVSAALSSHNLRGRTDARQLKHGCLGCHRCPRRPTTIDTGAAPGQGHQSQPPGEHAEAAAGAGARGRVGRGLAGTREEAPPL